MQLNTQIVEKVKKLLALSKSSNINEATNAAAIANKLILQHRISEESLAVSEQEYYHHSEPMFDDNVPVYISAHITLWKARLLCVLAHHHGCAVWNDKASASSKGKRGVSRFRLIGRYVDVQLVRQLFVWLIHRIQHFSEMECRGYGYVTRNSYCNGIVKGLESLFRKARDQAANTSESFLQNARRREKDAQEYMYRKYNLVPNAKARRTFDSEAFQRGIGVGTHLGGNISPKEGG